MTKWNVEELTPGRTLESDLLAQPGRPARVQAARHAPRRPPRARRSCCANDDRIIAGHAVPRAHRSRSTSPSVTTAAASRSSSSSAGVQDRGHLPRSRGQQEAAGAAREPVSTSCSTARRAAARRCWRARSPTSLGMVFVFFNCGAVVEASDFLVIDPGARVAIRRAGDGLRQDRRARSRSRRRPSIRDRAYLVFLDELNRCQEICAQRADAGARLDAPRVPPDREHVHPDPRQRAVHRRRQPRPRVHRHVRHRRRPARSLRAAADGLPAAEGRGRDPRSAATRDLPRPTLEAVVAVADAIRKARTCRARCRSARPTRPASTSRTHCSPTTASARSPRS